MSNIGGDEISLRPRAFRDDCHHYCLSIGLVAPAINIALEVKPAAILLRFIWPIFFALVGTLGLIGMIFSWKQKTGLRVNLATAVSMLICYLLVPVINGAMDNDQMGLWKSLHITTVALTFVTLILHLVYVFRRSKRV